MSTVKSIASPIGTGASLSAFDLNLLVAFEALWLERSVTGAGRRLGLSQPATSAALARLRGMLGDPLFVRGKRGLDPTTRCSELAAPLAKTLVELRNVLAGSSFDPAATTRSLRVGAVDAAIAAWMPSVLARTMKEAPNAEVHVLAIDPARATQALEDGAIDLALSPLPSPSASVRSKPLYPVEMVTVVRPSHPLAKRKSAAARLASFPRVQVLFEGQPPVKAAVILSSFLAVPPILAQSDGWSLVPRPYAAALAREGVVTMLPLPAGMRPSKMTMQLLWPQAQDASPASKWLRAIIAAPASKSG